MLAVRLYHYSELLIIRRGLLKVNPLYNNDTILDGGTSVKD